MAEAKRCNVCGEVKDLAEFYKAVGMADGHRGDCKACNLAAKHARYIANPEPEKARVKKWQQENAARHLATQRRRRARPEVKARDRDGYLQRKYGITQADYAVMLERQGGGCAICGRSPSAQISLHVDHEHGSNRVRGLLCFRCNNALGDLGDSPEILQRAATYLSRDDELDRLIRLRLQRELLGQQDLAEVFPRVAVVGDEPGHGGAALVGGKCG